MEQTEKKPGLEFDPGLALIAAFEQLGLEREKRSGDQYQNSPCDVNALENKWVTRIRDMIAQDEYG